MTEEQEMAVESVRKFVQNEIEPEIRAHGESHFSKEQLVKWSKSNQVRYCNIILLRKTS